MSRNLCKRYGFDAEVIAERLALLDLGSSDHALVNDMQQYAIRPHADKIINTFYDVLSRDKLFNTIIDRGYSINKLKRTYGRYILNLGVGFDTAGYFEERLRVGMVHEKVGVPLSLYQCAYRLLQQMIIDSISQDIRSDNARYQDLITLILKITTLDMSLAIETYHITIVRNFERSLDNILHEDAELRHKVDTDGLTGLGSHEYIMNQVNDDLTDFMQHGKPLCLIMADLDHFKQINDTHGHLVGDRVLQDVAARMQSAVRDFDRAGRYGGEEFIIILTDTSLEMAQEIAERIRMRVSDSPVHARDIEIPITISQGVSMAHRGDTPETLIGRADDALYTAKAAGRNCVRVDRDSTLLRPN